MKSSGLSIVVTGGAGFIGSHLCETLLKEGNKVVCVDNFVTGRKENIRHLVAEKNFSLIEHDITKPLKLDESIDQVYNLASPASPADFAKIPLQILLANSVGVKNMLDLAVEKNAIFLQASTSEVYGDPLQHPQRETYLGNVNPIGARGCYDEGKRFAEALVMTYNRKFNAQTRIARIFNTFGPRMRKDDGRAVPSFINAALLQQPLTVFGNGEQTRSFCFVTDLVAGLVRLMESNYNMPVNLGNPHEITVLQLAQLIKKLSESSSAIVFKPALQDDPEKRKPCIQLAQQQLKWKPKVSLQQGLLKTIKRFKGH